jgi:hypothetical protein
MKMMQYLAVKAMQLGVSASLLIAAWYLLDGACDWSVAARQIKWRLIDAWERLTQSQV